MGNSKSFWHKYRRFLLKCKPSEETPGHGREQEIVQVETIQGTSIPAIPHSITITASGPNRNWVELTFPASLAPMM